MMSRTHGLRIPLGGCPGNDWPAIPDPPASLALAIQFQLEQTQWWSLGDLEHAQFKQLANILRHAYDARRLARIDVQVPIVSFAIRVA